MKATDDLKILPLKSGQARPIQDDVAAISFGKEPGQVNRQGANRYVTIAANVYGKDLGTASKAVTKAIAGAGETPKGIIVSVQGQLQLLADTLQGLQTGLVKVIVVIFLMLAAYYHSFALSAIILAEVPAVIAYGGHPRKASTVFARRNSSKVYGCKFSRKNIYSRFVKKQWHFGC